MQVFLRRFVFCLIVLVFAASGMAQVATGTYPYGTFDNKGLDTINVGSLNVHFSISVLNKTGRGVPFYYNLSYDNSVWYPSMVNGVQTWTPVQNFGWRGDTEIAVGYVSYDEISEEVSRDTCTRTRDLNYVYHDSLGAAHPFNGATQEVDQSGDTSDPCDDVQPATGLTAVATDGSGYTINVTGLSANVTLTSASGHQISPPH